MGRSVRITLLFRLRAMDRGGGVDVGRCGTPMVAAAVLLGLPNLCRRRNSSTGTPWRLDCGGSGRRWLGDGGRDSYIADSTAIFAVTPVRAMRYGDTPECPQPRNECAGRVIDGPGWSGCAGFGGGSSQPRRAATYRRKERPSSSIWQLFRCDHAGRGGGPSEPPRPL